ncbi:recombination protein RecR [Nitritalea halalkaliphila LW7]|uniref:Recombination protein RecR n=1 Tax=Nitritalea halalkaliphila LW7 TaxID=1189621 RepID=I5C5N1_9BACT|nr:recombination mediator RecR [Nitritalea halalkaliphila]EIM77133.1 recombination protein RecR [Nitritalea halalkaliphila LW7]
MNYPSKLIEQAVLEISKLPGIGKKTALRLALHLLKQNEQTVEGLTGALSRLKKETRYCERCHNLSDGPLCTVCASPSRQENVICVVAEVPDLIAIENTGQYRGTYHVLGGILSPMHGIGPEELQVASLLERVKSAGEEMEIIFALPSTMDGDTTSFYLMKLLKPFGVNISTVARGIPIGGELEYTDEVTLGRSILARVKYDFGG